MVKSWTKKAKGYYQHFKPPVSAGNLGFSADFGAGRKCAEKYYPFSEIGTAV